MIEEIIDFIFGNIFILIIILGAISSFFGKKESKEKRPAAPSQPRPNPNPVSDTLKEFQRKYQESIGEEKKAAEPLASPIRGKVKKAEPAISSAHDDFLKEQERLQEKARQISRKTNSIRSTIATEKAGEKAEMPVFSKNTLVNGIIMAEVLGKPRARRMNRK
ncbi:MAG: hypothetical protein ACI4XL_04545 [Bacillus sp. (in: firmicutes)]